MEHASSVSSSCHLQSKVGWDGMSDVPTDQRFSE